MSCTRSFLAFWRRLLLGDDWRLTAAPLCALALTTLLHQQSLAAWWLVPAAVALALTASIRQVTRNRRRLPR